VSQKKAPIREPAAKGAQDDAADEAEIARSLHKWKRATLCLGLALAVTIVTAVPFSYGHSLHRYWEAIGKKVLFLSGALWLAVAYSAMMTFIMWKYLRGVKRINKEYAKGGDSDE
jgi:hypothetical protein